MPVDRPARRVLREALVHYMTGAINSFAFDELCATGLDSKDANVQEIVEFVWSLYDDFVDHPIAVCADDWNALRRIAAFVETDLDVVAPRDTAYWPFATEAEWQANAHRVDALALPDYDPDVHSREVNRWWNQIPTSLGLVLLAAFGLAIALLCTGSPTPR